MFLREINGSSARPQPVCSFCRQMRLSQGCSQEPLKESSGIPCWQIPTDNTLLRTPGWRLLAWTRLCHQALFLVQINSRISDIPPRPLQCRVSNQPCGTFQALSEYSNRQVGVQSQIDRCRQSSTLLLKNAQAMNLPAPNKRPETEAYECTCHNTTSWPVHEFRGSRIHESLTFSQ